MTEEEAEASGLPAEVAEASVLPPEASPEAGSAAGEEDTALQDLRKLQAQIETGRKILSGGSGSKIKTPGAVLGNLFEVKVQTDVSALESLLEYLVKSVATLSEAAQKTAEAAAGDGAISSVVKTLVARLEATEANSLGLEGQVVELRSQLLSRAATDVDAQGGTAAAAAAMAAELEAKEVQAREQLAEQMAANESLKGEVAELKAMVTALTESTDALKGKTGSIEEALAKAEKELQQADEQERMAVQQEIARVELELLKIREAQSEASAGASDWKKEAAEMEKRAAEKAKETAALAAMKERKRADKASAEQDAAAAEQAAALAEAGEVAEAMAAEAKAKAEEEAAEKQAVLEAELEAQKAAAEEAAAAAAAAARTGGWGAQAVTSLITQIIALRSHLQEQLEAHLMMDSEPVEEGGQEAEAEHRDWLVEQHTLAVGAEAQMAKAEGELANHLNGTEENQPSDEDAATIRGLLTQFSQHTQALKTQTVAVLSKRDELRAIATENESAATPKPAHMPDQWLSVQKQKAADLVTSAHTVEEALRAASGDMLGQMPLATNTLLHQMTGLRLKMHEQSKQLSKKISSKAGILDQRIQSLQLQLERTGPEVLALGAQIGNVMEAMEGKANAESLAQLEELMAQLKDTGVPEVDGTLEAMSQIRNSLKEKADVHQLDEMKGDLMIQLYDIVDKQSAKLRESEKAAAATAGSEAGGGGAAEKALAELQAEFGQMRSALDSTQQELQQTQAAMQAEVEEAAAARLFMQAELAKSPSDKPDGDWLEQSRDQIVAAAVAAAKADWGVIEATLQAKVDEGALEQRLGETKAQLEKLMTEADRAAVDQMNAALQAVGGGGNDASGPAPLLLSEWTERARPELMKRVAEMIAAANGSSGGHPFQPAFSDPITGATSDLTGGMDLDALAGEAGLTKLEFGQEPQFHVVMGQFRAPSTAGLKHTRPVGGGGAAIKHDSELEYLEEKLVARLSTLQSMYENRGWGVRDRRVKTQMKVYSALADETSCRRASSPASRAAISSGAATPTSTRASSTRAHRQSPRRASGGSAAGLSASDLAGATSLRLHTATERPHQFSSGQRLTPSPSYGGAAGQSAYGWSTADPFDGGTQSAVQPFSEFSYGGTQARASPTGLNPPPMPRAVGGMYQKRSGSRQSGQVRRPVAEAPRTLRPLEKSR